MFSIDVIKSILPLVKAAAETVASFTGGDDDARTDSTIGNAFDVLGSILPLIGTFQRGGEVSPDDVRLALEGQEQALNDFDDEIARQEAAGGG